MIREIDYDQRWNNQRPHRPQNVKGGSKNEAYYGSGVCQPLRNSFWQVVVGEIACSTAVLLRTNTCPGCTLMKSNENYRGAHEVGPKILRFHPERAEIPLHRQKVYIHAARSELRDIDPL
jgi:hypothetical protein